MTYPSGKVITYNYTNDRATSVLNGAATIATSINYKPFGGMSSITYGNGLTSTIGYDTQYRSCNARNRNIPEPDTMDMTTTAISPASQPGQEHIPTMLSIG